VEPDAKTRPDCDPPADAECGSPESHWGPRDVEGQPPRDAVLGLGRMVIETRDRLGLTATPDAVVRDLRERGIGVTAEEVGRFWKDAG
jgi:hypothetical protein